jgi:hypothetical protein
VSDAFAKLGEQVAWAGTMIRVGVERYRRADGVEVTR